ncbi:hypothetical protein [Halorussus marinus]|uniref:hypothetical protein n=1 Tax=Halorussus marinus TaxID=2505976 RepID=UPI00109224E2|nr:hypothetical protein [Halorussus marinus]
MVPLTRRRLLQGATAAMAGLAGCGESVTDTATDSASVPPEDGDRTIPDHRTVRNAENRPPVWFRDVDATTETASDDDPPTHRDGRGFVAGTEDADRLRYADVEGAEAARQFVADTDFGEATVYVLARPVRECLTLELCNVSWSERDVEVDFGSRHRDADVSCRADAHDGVSVLIRIPEALDPDEVNSYGSSWGSGPCRVRRRPPDGDGTTTEAPDYGPKTRTNATETTEAER